MRAEPHRLVFSDETAVKTNMTRLRGPCAEGSAPDRHSPFGQWRTRTFVAGLTANALVEPWIIEGAMNGDAFAAYVETQLALAPEPGTVVILDNLSTQKNARAAMAPRDRGCWFLFPRAYSPDPNPIEMAITQLKAHLGCIGARTFDQPQRAIGQISDLFSQQECWSCLRHAAYAST
jgi:transposase